MRLFKHSKMDIYEDDTDSYGSINSDEEAELLRESSDEDISVEESVPKPCVSRPPRLWTLRKLIPAAPRIEPIKKEHEEPLPAALPSPTPEEKKRARMSSFFKVNEKGETTSLCFWCKDSEHKLRACPYASIHGEPEGPPIPLMSIVFDGPPIENFNKRNV